jgi:hypothetical protein
VKHEEIYDKHADRKSKPPRKKFKESQDHDARQRRVSFKNYVRELEEDFLDAELDSDDAQEQS